MSRRAHIREQSANHPLVHQKTGEGPQPNPAIQANAGVRRGANHQQRTPAEKRTHHKTIILKDLKFARPRLRRFAKRVMLDPLVVPLGLDHA